MRNIVIRSKWNNAVGAVPVIPAMNENYVFVESYTLPGVISPTNTGYPRHEPIHFSKGATIKGALLEPAKRPGGQNEGYMVQVSVPAQLAPGILGSMLELIPVRFLRKEVKATGNLLMRKF